MPNTLEQLNGFSNTSLTYQDQRAYAISFNPSSPVNQTVSILEDAPFVSTAGIDITGMVSAPRSMRYRIDLSSLAFTAYVDWGTLPNNVSEEIPGPNIFDLVGYFDEITWNEIKAPTITVPDQTANFSYTSTLTYPNPANTANDATKSWTTSVTVTATPDLSTPTDWNYVKNSPGTIAGTPQIIQTGAGTFTLTITPSDTAVVSSLSSSGSGGTSSFNAITKVLTLTGTYTQINSHLNSIVLTTPSNLSAPFTLTYLLTRPSGATFTIVQNIYPVEAYAIGTATFAEDTPFALQYTIQDESATATNFTISVAQTVPDVANTPGYFTVNGSNVGTTWTASNTRANINAANVWYFPPADWSSDLQFIVNQSKVDSGNTFVQANNSPVTIFISSVNNEIVNMIGRTYTSNTVNNIFSSQTPVINDGPDIGQTYTITLSSTLGKFGNSFANAIAANSYSFTGNQSSTNSEFTNMVFVPNPGTSSTGTFTYTQSRNGNSQVNQSLALTGVKQPITPSTYTFTGDATWTPTPLESYYGNAQFVLVGGGGGGAVASGAASQDGGGGGGGGVNITYRSPTTTPLDSGLHTITIGQGGVGKNLVVTGGYSQYDGTANAGQSTTVVNSSYTLTAAGGQGGRVFYNLALPAGTRYINNRGGNAGSGGYTGGTGADFGAGGGGAGAGQNGFNAIYNVVNSGNGGAGKTVTGVGTFGGGGAGSGLVGGAGGGASGNAISVNGTPNTGGGGSAYFPTSLVGNGGSGIVIIKIT